MYVLLLVVCELSEDRDLPDSSTQFLCCWFQRSPMCNPGSQAPCMSHIWPRGEWKLTFPECSLCSREFWAGPRLHWLMWRVEILKKKKILMATRWSGSNYSPHMTVKSLRYTEVRELPKVTEVVKGTKTWTLLALGLMLLPTPSYRLMLH